MNISEDDFNLVSSSLEYISKYEDCVVENIIKDEYKDLVLLGTKKEAVPEDCDSFYNAMAKILTHGYNVCFTESLVLDVFDEEV